MGPGGDCRPHPESNAKLLRGFRQAGASEVTRFAFLKDHFRCCVERGLGVQEALAVLRGDREGTGQIERFVGGVDRIWRLVGFVGRGRRKGGLRVPGPAPGVVSGARG